MRPSYFTPSVAKPVRIWLLIGLVMVLGQILIGGVTRLTDSGLSITEWEVVSGVLHPLNATQWNEAFNAYKIAASRQHEVLHATMSLEEFKWIYFWEYFHRLWARGMGLIFVIPFYGFEERMDSQLAWQTVGMGHSLGYGSSYHGMDYGKKWT